MFRCLAIVILILFLHFSAIPFIDPQGTIVEWTVQVGQAVQEEDVVALIETDKVTVDIKATMAGVVTQQFGGV